MGACVGGDRGECVGRGAAPCDSAVCHAEAIMRDAEIIEAELIEISAIADDLVKFERIVAWCATHPDEVPFALHNMMTRPKTATRRAAEAEAEQSSAGSNS